MVNSVEKPNTTQSIDACEPISLSDYDARIAELAYYKAESRNFEPGYELDDWLEAEQDYLQGATS